MRTNTLIADRISFADTDYTELVNPWNHSDAVLTSVMAANASGGALAFTLALAASGSTPTSANDVKATSVANGATTNLIDGFELPVPAWYVLYLKCAGTTSTYAHAFGMKGSQGTVGTKAVLGS